MTKPTDGEIRELWAQHAPIIGGVLTFTRAALERWGTPQQAAPDYVGNGMFKGESIQKAAEHWANWCDVRCISGLADFLRVVAQQAAPQQAAPAGRKSLRIITYVCPVCAASLERQE